MSQNPSGGHNEHSNRRTRNRHAYRSNFHGHPDRANPNHQDTGTRATSYLAMLPGSSHYDINTGTDQLYHWNANYAQNAYGNLPGQSDMPLQGQNAAAQVGITSQRSIQGTIPQIFQNSLAHLGLTPATTENTHPGLPTNWHFNSEITSRHQPLYTGHNQSAPSHRQSQQHMTNPFGTREELEADDYQSPLTAMFGRFERIREAREAQHAAQSQRQNGGSTDTSVLTASGQRPIHVRSEPRRRRRLPRQSSNSGPTSGGLWTSDQFQEWFHTRTTNQNTTANDLTSIHLDATDDEASDSSPNPIDQQQRGDVVSLEDLDVNIACQICKEQKMDTLLEPCMHLAICHWCSDLSREMSRRPGVGWRCPICRAKVRRCRKVFLITSEKHGQDEQDAPKEPKDNEDSKEKRESNANEDAAMAL
ncbi:hypothetical protein LTS17_010197 [Exophiala oligosperma]